MQADFSTCPAGRERSSHLQRVLCRVQEGRNGPVLILAQVRGILVLRGMSKRHRGVYRLLVAASPKPGLRLHPPILPTCCPAGAIAQAMVVTTKVFRESLDILPPAYISLLRLRVQLLMGILGEIYTSKFTGLVSAAARWRLCSPLRTNVQTTGYMPSSFNEQIVCSGVRG